MEGVGTILILGPIFGILGLFVGWQLHKMKKPQGIGGLEGQIANLELISSQLSEEIGYFEKMNQAFSKYYPVQHSEVAQIVEDSSGNR